jgi:hypothetical protein
LSDTSNLLSLAGYRAENRALFRTNLPESIAHGRCSRSADAIGFGKKGWRVDETITDMEE